jgi:hypothetical protein
VHAARRAREVQRRDPQPAVPADLAGLGEVEAELVALQARQVEAHDETARRRRPRRAADAAGGLHLRAVHVGARVGHDQHAVAQLDESDASRSSRRACALRAAGLSSSTGAASVPGAQVQLQFARRPAEPPREAHGQAGLGLPHVRPVTRPSLATRMSARASCTASVAGSSEPLARSSAPGARSPVSRVREAAVALGAQDQVARQPAGEAHAAAGDVHLEVRVAQRARHVDPAARRPTGRVTARRQVRQQRLDQRAQRPQTRLRADAQLQARVQPLRPAARGRADTSGARARAGLGLLQREHTVGQLAAQRGRVARVEARQPRVQRSLRSGQAARAGPGAPAAGRAWRPASAAPPARPAAAQRPSRRTSRTSTSPQQPRPPPPRSRGAPVEQRQPAAVGRQQHRAPATSSTPGRRLSVALAAPAQRTTRVHQLQPAGAHFQRLAGRRGRRPAGVRSARLPQRSIARHGMRAASRWRPAAAAAHPA